MNPIGTWLRVNMRHRWRSLVILALLVASAGGTIIAAVAGARRGDTALRRLDAVTLPATAVVLPSPGLSADWAVIGPAVALITLLVAGGAALAGRATFAAGRRQAPVRGSATAAAAARAGFPVPVVVGARFALEPGRGQAAVPVRQAQIGAVAGALGIVAAFTFSYACPTPWRTQPGSARPSR